MHDTAPLSVQGFYDDLAQHYHLLFADWDEAVRQQGKLFSEFLAARLPEQRGRLLDAACGIGTQTIGLALEGWAIRGTDLSPASIERARREAERFGAPVSFGVADLRRLTGYVAGPFEAVLALDNALPHLESDEDLALGLSQVADLLAPEGLFLASLRDYDRLLANPPRSTAIRVFDRGEERRIIFQLWDWDMPSKGYRLTQYIVRHRGQQLASLAFHSHYRALRRSELNRALAEAGLGAIQWVEPEESGFYQPLVVARRGS